jgi:hypothetical protein
VGNRELNAESQESRVPARQGFKLLRRCCRKGAFYYYNTSLGPDTADAAYTTKKITEALTMITQDRLSRVNSISADTYSIILDSFEQISIKPSLKYYYFISCDPYGL